MKSKLAILDLGKDGFFNFSPGLSFAYKAKYKKSMFPIYACYFAYAPNERVMDYWWINNNQIKPLSLLSI